MTFIVLLKNANLIFYNCDSGPFLRNNSGCAKSLLLDKYIVSDVTGNGCSADCCLYVSIIDMLKDGKGDSFIVYVPF